jgi:hypothetical protein
MYVCVAKVEGEVIADSPPLEKKKNKPSRIRRIIPITTNNEIWPLDKNITPIMLTV